jgi:NAD(P)-dependent dehydrogenase (short-subunit alcohol dehydrogenase family)
MQGVHHYIKIQFTHDSTQAAPMIIITTTAITTPLRMAPTSTIIITGANGALGSKTALEICKAYPGKYHLVLTACNVSDANILAATTKLRRLSPIPSFSWSTVELTSLNNAKLFAADIKKGIKSSEIPPLRGGGIMNSAAVFSYATGEAGRTSDGLDMNYGVNVLAPMLLVTELLEIL